MRYGTNDVASFACRNSANAVSTQTLEECIDYGRPGCLSGRIKRHGEDTLSHLRRVVRALCVIARGVPAARVPLSPQPDVIALPAQRV